MDNYLVKLDPLAGDKIDDIFKEAHEIASERDCVVEFSANGCDMKICKDTDMELARNHFDDTVSAICQMRMRHSENHRSI